MHSPDYSTNSSLAKLSPTKRFLARSLVVGSLGAALIGVTCASERIGDAVYAHLAEYRSRPPSQEEFFEFQHRLHGSSIRIERSPTGSLEAVIKYKDAGFALYSADAICSEGTTFKRLVESR